jgi:hypothetical protein
MKGQRKMRSNQSYQVNPSVVCTEMDEGAVLLNLETKYYYHLNETSLRIWEGYLDNMQRSQIVKMLIDDYEVDEQHSFHCVCQFTKQLEEEGLLKRH